MLLNSIWSFVRQTAPASLRSHVQAWKAMKSIYRSQLNVSNGAIRQEATNRILFNVLRNLFMSLSFWLSSEMIEYGLGHSAIYIFALSLKIISVVFMLVGMRWVSIFYVCDRISDDAIRSMLVNNEWVLCFRPHDGKKAITFRDNGEIGLGKNGNEFRWSVEGGVLELITSENKIHNKFYYSALRSKFLAIDDSSLPAFKGQFLEISGI